MAEKEVYKCLNPRGTKEAVDTFPLAPRLTSLNGKTVHLSLCGEQDIWAYLEKDFKREYPDVDWTVKKTYSTAPVPLSEEERKTTDAVILGVCW